MILDWGHVTPEGVKSNTNEFIYVYNHDLSTEEKVQRTIRFAIGRLLHYDENMPPNPIHDIVVDIRGQAVSKDTCDRIKNSIIKGYKGKNKIIISFKTN
jgi:hypothetical protein